MRKITSFFTMALLLAGFTTVKADILEELQGNYSVAVGTQMMTMDELSTEKWYVMYQERGSGGYAWDRSYQVDDSPIYKSSGTSVISDGNTLTTDAAQYMVRFVETETADDVYYIQFGTGNYFGMTSSETSSSQDIPAVSSIYDAATMHMYNIVVDDVTQEGYFAFNLWTSSGTDGWRLDNNGSGSKLATWETGQGTALSGNYHWNIYEVILTEMDDREAAYAYAASTYNTYASYSGSFATSTTGEPGTYDADAVAAFEAAIEALEAVDGPDGDDLTTEELNTLADNVIAAYKAVEATLVSYASTIADGYYFIQTYPFFYVTETTEDTEDPETGEVIPGTTTTTYSPKSMYAVLSAGTISAKWATSDGTAPYLWKVTTVDADNKTYRVENMGTDGQISAIAQSTATTLSTDIDTTMVFDYATTINDTIYYNIRMSGGTERGYQYLHPSGHSSGAGTSGNIVGWCNTSTTTSAGGSEWTLIPVSDEEAAAIIEAYAPYKDEAGRQSAAEVILEDLETKMEIAIDTQTNIYTDSPLANEDNLTSPHSDAEEGEGDGYEINVVLLDDDAETFWHSDWHGEFEDEHHYLQVECADDAIPESFVFEFTRRTNSSNQITEWAIYGTNDADAATDCSTCTLLATESTPYSSSNMTITSSVIENSGNFKYLRFQCTATSTSTNSKFFHLAEFQVYPATVIINESSQAIAMGEIFTNLEAAVAAAEAEGDSITVETYAALKEAYDAFIAIYVDPDTLRTAIDDATSLINGIVTGTNPGEWSSDVASTLSSLVAEATAYDASGAYTPAQSAQYVADIEATMDAILAAANPVEEGKWYNFRFPTEELYESTGWSTSNADENTTYAYLALFNKLLAVSSNETTDEETGAYEIVQADPDLVGVGSHLYFIGESDLDYGTKDEAAQFRFIAVGDTAYIIQNRLTGLFLRATSTASNVTLDIQPSLWKNTAMGYGKVRSEGTDILGNDNANLHGQLAASMLVTWTSEEVSSNTGFLIEYVEDVASDYEGTEFNMLVVPGNYYAYTYPVTVTALDGTMYGVQVDETGTSITLETLEDNTAAAGQPFIYIAAIDDPDLYDASADEEANVFTHGYELNVTAGNSGRLNGTYESTTAPAGSVIPDGNTLAITKASSTTIAANSAWINAQIEDVESTLTVTVSEDTYTAITTAVENAVKGGDIYTIDGVKVGTGNLSSVKNLKKGLYIVNGTKVLVK